MRATRLLSCCFVHGRCAALCAGSYFLFSHLAFPQGSLTPPAGTPAPTMKSLDQIASTGIAICDTNTAGDANYHYIISTPGGYYLRSNLNVTKPNGIHVITAGVTIDLNGFQISRSSGSGGDGVTIDKAADRCVVKDGSVNGFANGVYCVTTNAADEARSGGFISLTAANCTASGLSGGRSWRIHNCAAIGNGGTGGIISFHGSEVANCTARDNTGTYGIQVSGGSVVANCTAYGNQALLALTAGFGCTLINCNAYSNQGGVFAIQAADGSTLINCTAHNNTTTFSGIAIAAGPGATLTNCAASDNTADFGISAGGGSTLTNCSASFNSSSASVSGGIRAGDSCTILGCTSYNHSSAASASITTGMGIDAGVGATIKDCTTTNNEADGIRVDSNCLVSGCTSSGNGVNSPNGDGIRTTGDNNRIDGNHVASNSQYGIRSSGTSIVVRNSSNGNGTANYNVSTGTNIGPIQTPNTATSPWANF